MYLEDDPVLTIGRDLYLRDVDSNISTVTAYATGELSQTSLVNYYG